MNFDILRQNKVDEDGYPSCWEVGSAYNALGSTEGQFSKRTLERWLEQEFLPKALQPNELRDAQGRLLRAPVVDQEVHHAQRSRALNLLLQIFESEGARFLMANDLRGGRKWLRVSEDVHDDQLFEYLRAFILKAGKDVVFWPHATCAKILSNLLASEVVVGSLKGRFVAHAYKEELKSKSLYKDLNMMPELSGPTIDSHLDRLESESIHVIREVMAYAQNPVMLYSLGKDSSVMLHLARKAFFPAKLPFPLLHVDTGWKFTAMYEFRNMVAASSDLDLLIHKNPDGVARNINPFDHGSAVHTDIMKTQGLKQALNLHKFDVAFGGARRDEEKSRAKERIFSFRSESHSWDPKSQRPELWNLYNGKKAVGESIRVFPLSNWTELDIWLYIYRENLDLVPLYFAADRPIVERDGMLVMVDDERMQLTDGEKIKNLKVRFRTLGCYPLTGAVQSHAVDLESVILELITARTSERQGRAIDKDNPGSMEKKKLEGYF